MKTILEYIGQIVEENPAVDVTVYTTNPHRSYINVWVQLVYDDGLSVVDSDGKEALIYLTNITSIEIDGIREHD